VTVYKAAQFLSSISLDGSLGSSASLEALELVFDTTDQNLAILSRFSDASKKQLRTYQLDLSTFAVELIAEEPFTQELTARTLHFGLQQDNSLIDLRSLKKAKSLDPASEVLAGHNDDVILVRSQDNTVDVIDLQSGVSKQVQLHDGE